jgi:hypothetical protein
MSHLASCSCGQLTIACEGEPVRISVCHCLNCQRRTGSAFGAQARFPAAATQTSGRASRYQRIGESGRTSTYAFCPDCGVTVFYQNEIFPGLVAVPLGAFADPNFLAPTISIWEERKHAWVTIGGEIEHQA